MLVSFVAQTNSFGADTHATIPGFERFYAGEDADQVRGGLLLLGELNCTSCHEAEGAASEIILQKQAPILSKVGERARQKYFEAMLANPNLIKSGTTMPDLLHDKKGIKKRETIKAISAFLKSTGVLAESYPKSQLVKQGEDLFHKVGCVACHDPRRKNEQAIVGSVHLGELGKKYSIPGLASFLKNPLAVRPSARMPHLNLNEKEARAIANYLLQDIDVRANVTFKYYEGVFDELPDFSKLKVRSTGKASGFDVSVGAKSDHFALEFQGFFSVAREGEYRIYLGSDDGAKLYVDDKLLIDTDGVHPVVRKNAPVKLSKGIHKIDVQYFEKGGGEELYVDIEGPGLSKREMGQLLHESREAALKKAGPKADAELNIISKGAELFSSIGCASCHDLKKEGKNLVSSLKAKKLKALKVDSGCLSESLSNGIPKYELSEIQRKSLKAALTAIKKENISEDRSQLVNRYLTAFNCYQCHQRGELGGVSQDRNKFFTGSQPEMGDEGRLPPTLGGIGGKLKSDWLKKLLHEGANDRFYMHTRMPRFGNQLDKLHQSLVELDKVEPFEIAKIDVSNRRKKVAGRKLAGEGFLSCIKCHRFGNINATGIQAINLTTMASRLNKDWFMRYMEDPQALRPQTRMPAAFPDGQTFYDDILDGTSIQQIHAIWLYLEDGTKAQVPDGLSAAKAELVAEKEPIIYRNFIQDAGPRAIGIGYPEKINLAFDAQQLRLALLWQGKFIDASKHWSGRGQGFQSPLGENILKFDGGVSFAKLEDDKTPWPKKSSDDLGMRFKGYRFNKTRQPILLYKLGSDVDVADHPFPEKLGKQMGLSRQIELSSKVASKIYFRAIGAKSIKKSTEDWYQIDDDWQMNVSAKSDPLIRKAGSGMELLVPLDIDNKGTSFVVKYRW